MKETPMTGQLKSIWSNIWSHKKSYNKTSRHIENIKDTYENNEPQMYEDITIVEIANTF